MQSLLDRITYHAVYDDTIVDALGYAHEHRFAGIQVGVETPHLSFERQSAADCRAIARLRERHGLIITLHAPDEVASLFVTSRELADGIAGYFRKLFQFGERVGADLVTIHPGSMVSFRTDGQLALAMPEADRPLYQSAFRSNLERLIDMARGRFALCLEYWKRDATLEAVLQPYLDGGQVSLCWDIAKLHDASGSIITPLEDYFRRNIRHVRQVHLHDIRHGQAHRVLGTGTVEWMRILPRLTGAPVHDCCIEVRPREQALESLVWLRARLRDAFHP